MGARKRNAAAARKEVMDKTAIAKLNDCPTSPRKMRLVADTIRGKDVVSALNILKFSPKGSFRSSGEIAPIGHCQLGSQERGFSALKTPVFTSVK